MKSDLDILVSCLTLQAIDEYKFLGQCTPREYKRVFGGQVLAQALSAAMRTVPVERVVHSMHAYFLLPGDIKKPITYSVDPIRDGGTFTTRRVVANQDERVIFNTSISFQTLETGFEHHVDMPSAPAPETLISERELWQQLAARNTDMIIPLSFFPIDSRVVNPNILDQPKVQPASLQAWFKTNGKLPDEPRLHQQILAYISDKHLMGTALRPHGISFLTPGLQAASLDHSLWFHDDFRVDEWMLYVTDSTVSSRGRGLNRGSIYSADGRLVASTAQEGLMRINGGS